MKKILVILVVLGFITSIFAIEEFKMTFINENVSKDTELKMREGSNYIINFYMNINFPIQISNINVRVFTFFDDYKSHQKLNSNAKSNNGYFSSSKHEIVLFSNEKLIKTFHHEFNHYLLRAYFKKPPKWVNEGLSEYFEYLNNSNPITILPQKNKIARVKSWVDEKIENDIEKILSGSNKQWTEQNIKPEYRSSTISYAIVFFLMSIENGDQILGKIIKGLMNGEKSIEAIRSTYHGSITKFNEDFIRFYSEWN
ncbi:MAG: hypothetical protein P9L95_09230 [Candidatus Tenebribacter mawsonii]|nr:hypothetical protein [Candidatus Tenebribacter mawsonii]